MPRAPRGGAVSSHEPPVGSTYTCVGAKSKACVIGVLSTTPPSHSKPALPLDGREDARDRGAGEDRLDERSARQAQLRAAEDVAGDHVQRDREILEPLLLDVARDQAAQRHRRHEVLAPAEQSQQTRDRLGGKHLAAPHPTSDPGELLDGVEVEPATPHERAVDRADRGRHDHVRAHAAFGEGAQHPDLYRPEGAPPLRTKAMITLRSRPCRAVSYLRR